MRKSRFVLALLGFAGLAALSAPASAMLSANMRLAGLEPLQLAALGTTPPGEQIVARIDLSDQRMYVYVGERLKHTFAVSTGASGYGTPTGRYQAEWLSPNHRSRKYNNAPMPWAVFFHEGYAVHGTTEIRRLGRPASHGCVRLHPDNAKTFFTLVKAHGMDATLITIVR